MSVFPGQQVRPFGGGYDRLAITVGDETHFVEYAALSQIVAYIEQECERQEQIWAARDQSLAASLGVPYIPSPIERVQPQNFFIGARPSLVASSIDFWPSVTSRAATSKAASEQMDQFDVLDVQLDVEVLCKYGPIEPQYIHERAGVEAVGEANKQIQRLSAAVHACLRLDPTLGGRIQPLQRPPTKSQGLPMAVPGVDKERTGAYYIYVGRRFRYVCSVNSF